MPGCSRTSPRDTTSPPVRDVPTPSFAAPAGELKRARTMSQPLSSDPFSDLLRLTRAKVAATGGFACGGTWGFRVPPPGQIVLAAVAKGSLWLRLEHHAPLRLVEGDVGLLSGRAGFVMSSAPSGPAIDVALADKGNGVEHIGAADECVVLSGRVTLDHLNAALLADFLPARILVSASSPRSPGLRSLIEQLLVEHTSTTPGAGVVSEKLAELIFVQVLRDHIASEAALPSGWFAALTDERILRALRVMHAEPGRAWSVATLAKAAGMSRTRFAVHFRGMAGLAPLAYLGTWRMRLAQRVLLEEDTPVRVLADTLGYGSESAFSHAFKRITGLSPRDYRAAARRDGDVAPLRWTERSRKSPAVLRMGTTSRAT